MKHYINAARDNNATTVPLMIEAVLVLVEGVLTGVVVAVGVVDVVGVATGSATGTATGGATQVVCVA